MVMVGVTVGVTEGVGVTERTGQVAVPSACGPVPHTLDAVTTQVKVVPGMEVKCTEVSGVLPSLTVAPVSTFTTL